MERLEAMVLTPGSTTPVAQHGYLEAKVSSVELGREGWRVHASLANVGRVPVHVLPAAAPGTPVSYPNEPFSLIVRIDSGGGVRQLVPLPATSFAPEVPATLKPGTAWQGTFSGPDVVKKKTLFYVGFGQFTYDTRFDPRPFSISSAKSGTA